MGIGETLVAAQWVFALVPSGHKTSHQLESLLHRRQLWHLRWQSSGEAPEPSGSPCLCKGIALLLQLRTPHPRVAAACFLDISFTSKQETQSFAHGRYESFPQNWIIRVDAKAPQNHNCNLQARKIQSANSWAGWRPRVGSALSTSGAKFRFYLDAFVCESFGQETHVRLFGKLRAGSAISTFQPTRHTSEPNFRLRILGEALGGSHIFDFGPKISTFAGSVFFGKP